MTTTTHTPTPWRIGTKHPCRIMSDASRNLIATTCEAQDEGTESAQQLADAAHIVRCINERDALLGLLRQAYDRFTENDMMPPNALLKTWMHRVESMLIHAEESHPGQRSA